MANFYGQFIGFGAGGEDAVPWTYPGTLYGYMIGGNVGGSPVVPHDMLQKWVFASDSNSTDVANLTLARDGITSALTSETYGYAACGNAVNHIERWIFSSDADAVEVGETVRADSSCSGASSSTHGFIFHGSSTKNQLQKYSVADGTDCADIASLHIHKLAGYGQTSALKGYTSGGHSVSPSPAAVASNIEAVTFADDSVSGDIGDITVARWGRESSSSLTYGYCWSGLGDTTRIDNFSFADESSTNDVGNIDGSAPYGTGCAGNSSTNAYVASGNLTNAIDKLSFASGGDASNVATVAQTINQGAGTQV